MENQLSMDEQFLGKINQLIEDNLDNENFSVEDLAKSAGLSRSMLHRKLIKLTGKSAGDIIAEKRLNLAKELLEKNVSTVSEIAYRVGFNSPSYFNRVFKKYFNVSPGDIRKGAVASIHRLPAEQQKKNQEIKISGNKRLRIYTWIAILLLLCITGGILIFPLKTKPTEKSIAILPFENLSTYKENQYFADGLVEDLLNRLSTVKDLKVISRTSSEMFRDKGNKSVPEIAEILGVNYIMEGSVQRESDKIRINIQLIDARKDDHILSKQYSRELNEVFDIQSEITGQIVDELSLIISDQQLTELQKSQTENLQAFNYYQIGRYLIKRRSKDEFLRSTEYFNKAINEDRSYALAYAGMAEAYYIMAWHRWIDENYGRNKAEEFALKALQIDKNISDAHTVLAGLYQEFDYNMDAAEKEYQKAILKNHNNASAYHYYAELLSLTGRPEKARETINKALMLDPFSFSARHLSAILYDVAGDYKKALEENRICQELANDHPWTLESNFYINLKLKNKEAAYENFRKYGEVAEAYTPQQADSAYEAEELKGMLRLKLKTTEWYPGKANCYILLGENEKAIEILEYAVNNAKLRPYDFFQVEKQDIKSDPRIKAIKKKLGLQNY